MNELELIPISRSKTPTHFGDRQGGKATEDAIVELIFNEIYTHHERLKRFFIDLGPNLSGKVIGLVIIYGALGEF